MCASASTSTAFGYTSKDKVLHRGILGKLAGERVSDLAMIGKDGRVSSTKPSQADKRMPPLHVAFTALGAVRDINEAANDLAENEYAFVCCAFNHRSKGSGHRCFLDGCRGRVSVSTTSTREKKITRLDVDR